VPGFGFIIASATSFATHALKKHASQAGKLVPSSLSFRATFTVAAEIFVSSLVVSEVQSEPQSLLFVGSVVEAVLLLACFPLP